MEKFVIIFHLINLNFEKLKKTYDNLYTINVHKCLQYLIIYLSYIEF